MNKQIVKIIVGLIVIGGLAFYGGMKYGQGQSASTATTGTRNFTGGPGGGRGTRGGGFIGGQIIARDNQSITVALRGNASSTSQGSGSKIIFYSTTTAVTKSVTGTANDLQIGGEINVTGTPNSDGSVTAQSIQIRPGTN